MPRHHEVADDDGRAEGGDLTQRFLAVGRGFGVEAPGADELGETQPRGGLVLDNQHTFAQPGRDSAVGFGFGNTIHEAREFLPSVS